MAGKGWKRCVVGPHTEQMLRLGHPWIIRDRFTDQWPQAECGERIALYAPDGELLAYALRDDDRRIVARVIGWAEAKSVPALNEKWFCAGFKAAMKLRENHICLEDTDAYRLVNAEGDFFPALTVDVYGDYLMVQLYSRMWEPYREPLVQALQQLMRPQGIYEKFRPRKTRALEKKGHKRYSKLLLGQQVPDHYQIKENGLIFEVDLKHGLHTGLFMDQRRNREDVMPMCTGKRVLNLFSFTGAFSVAAAAAGAVKVTSVDSSAQYQDWARKNFELNRINTKKHDFVVNDCQKTLEQMRKERKCFDVVIMDPPSFSTVGKNRFTTSGGTARLVAEVLELLVDGGVLVTSSNHQKVDLPEYLKELRRGALQAATPLRIIRTGGQGIDFPYSLTCPESRYLKFIIGVKG